ncbi:MAG: AsmA family protein [Bacteroidetes bacterium]|nr:AsmA family protein [Bacteroidota bacterium]
MKILKTLLLVFGSLVVLLSALAFAVPYFFKDEIKAAIDKEISGAVRADIVYHPDQISLSLFKEFPQLTVSTGEIGVFTREPFAGEHLFIAENVSISLDLWQLITGESIIVKGIILESPDINLKYLPDGRANFDIAVESEAEPASDTSAAFSLRIDHWELVNGKLSYDDPTIPFSMNLKGVEHQGSGDITEKIFDLKTYTAADTLSMSFDGTEYITNKKASADAIITISEDISKFTFKENTGKLNDFAFGLDGWFKMNEASYDMDLSIKSKDNSFKSILSLVPGIYTQSFTNLTASGSVDFSTVLKGTFSDTSMPGFRVETTIKDGMFRYPDLPEAVKNVNLDLVINNTDGIIDNTTVDLKRLHLNLGNNPIDAALKIENLKTFPLKAAVKASVNLADVTKMFPVDGLTLRGNFSLDAKADGIYDSVRQIIPSMNAGFSLSDGYAKSKDYPFAAENLMVKGSVINRSGKMAETVVDVSSLSLMLDGEQLEAAMHLENLSDYTWKVAAKGGVDLGKILKIFPVEGMSVSGKIKADVQTSGKYSDLTASRYDRLPTSGNLSLSDFSYSSNDLPYSVAIQSAAMIFTPASIQLEKFESKIGRSDFKARGSISNYLAYAFSEQGDLKGSLSLESGLLDLNEFMSEEEGAEADTSAMGVVPVPQRIDFQLNSKINTIKMMDYTLTDASGGVEIKNGTANLNNVRFNMLGGRFTVSGLYDPRNLKKPLYNLGLKIEDMSIRQASSSFSMVNKFAPIAQVANGNFSLDFKLAGALTEQMSPDLMSVDASGLVKIIQATIAGSKALSAVGSVTKLQGTEQVSLKDVLISASVKDGRLSVKPFDIALGKYATNVSGSSGLNGALDYAFKTLIPAEMAGNQITTMLVKSGITQPDAQGNIPLKISLGGTFSSPKAILLSEEAKAQVKQAVVEEVQEKGKEVVKEALQSNEAKKLIGNVLGRDSVAKDSSTKTPAVQKVLEDKLKGLLLKKKKKN